MSQGGKLSQSAKTAIGGMTAALSIVLMLPTIMGLWTYALPAFAGILIMFTIIELDKKWATGIFVAVSILSVMLLPNKEAAVFYMCFFGNYPIFKAIIEGKRMPRVLEYIIKIILFNACVLLASFIMLKVFGVPLDEFLDIEGETGWFAKYAIPITLDLANVTFIAFDFALTVFATAYIRTWQKRFRKLFRFK